MADIRSSQNIAQVEWQEPGSIKSFQTIAQVEYESGWVGGKVFGVSSPAKVIGVDKVNIAKVIGV